MLKLALTVKWISGLILSLLLAVGFSLLAQWQVGRSVVAGSSNPTFSSTKTIDLSEVGKPGEPFGFSELVSVKRENVLVKVSTLVELTPSKAVVIANRFQEDGTPGYWVVVPGNTDLGNIFVVLGFVKSKYSAELALGKLSTAPVITTKILGRYLPTEPPVEKGADGTYLGLSVPQLLNDIDWKSKQDKTYVGFLAATAKNPLISQFDLTPLTIGLARTDSEVNWLSSFYAIEWTVFAGFAVFMWWRLLADSYRKQQEELLA